MTGPKPTPAKPSDTSFAKPPSPQTQSTWQKASPAQKQALDSSAKKTTTGDPPKLGEKNCPLKNWKLNVTVTSADGTWLPKHDVEVTLTGISGTSGSETKTTKLVTATSPVIEFKGSDEKHYKIEAKVKDAKEGKLWTQVAAATVDLVPAIGEAVFAAALTIKPALNAHLKLTWTDPNAKVRMFPEDFPVKVMFDDRTSAIEKVKAGGKLTIPLKPAHKKFTLKFEGTHYIATAPKSATSLEPADPSATSEKLKAESDVDKLVEDKWRFFLTPVNWELRRADAAVTGASTYSTSDAKFTITEDEDIASDGTPAEVKFNPHWQYLRFEFFDRFFGRKDHAGKRVSIPAIPIEGARAGLDTSKTPAVPSKRVDTKSNWTIKTDKPDEMCHCLPWLIQKKGLIDSYAAEKKADEKVLIRIATKPKSYVHSKTKDERVLVVDPGADTLKASADRLKYYDLPVLWRSHKYFARFVVTPPPPAPGPLAAGATPPAPTAPKGKTFDKLTAAEAECASHDKRLIFSLDDIVITDDAYKRITLEKGNTAATPPVPRDRVCLFYHKFRNYELSSDAEKQGINRYDGYIMSSTGLYQPDVAGKESFHSQFHADVDKLIDDQSYIIDYPNWTRLIVAKGNCCDAFDHRTTEQDANEIVGARAAVRWVDSVGMGGAGTNVARDHAAGRKDKPFFSIHPYFDQLYNSTGAKYPGRGAAGTNQSIGRFDMVLVRCANRTDADEEEFVVMHFFRFHSYYGKVPAITTEPAVSEIADDAATVAWSTDIKTDGKLAYGTTTAYSDGSESVHVGGGFEMETDHSIRLTGLTAGTTYHYRISSGDPTGNRIVKKDYVFRTTGGPAAPAPVAPVPAETKEPSDFLKAGGDAKQKEYDDGSAMNIIKRLNGDESGPKKSLTVRAQLLPQDNSKKLKGHVVYFIEPVHKKEHAHFEIQVVGPDGRNWMAGSDGTGEIQAAASSGPEGQYNQALAYAAAHETAHGDSLPDEYNERWGSFSQNEASIKGNTPGDAYEDDATVWDDNTGSVPESAMMSGVVQMRNRYHWHSAEFARKAMQDLKFMVKLGTYDKYFVPPHEDAPHKSYIWWPIEDKVDDEYEFKAVREFKFKTGPGTKPVVSGVTATLVTDNSAVLVWRTDRESKKAKLEFFAAAIAPGAVPAFTLDHDEDEPTEAHAMYIANGGPDFHFRVIATDENEIESAPAGGSFSYAAAAGTAISGVGVSAITKTSARISLTTADDAIVQVLYGTTAECGSSKAGTGPAKKVHAIALTGLTEGVQYFYRIRVVAAGKVSAYPDNNYSTFTTKATNPPVITDFKMVRVSDTEAKFTWATDRPCKSKLRIQGFEQTEADIQEFDAETSFKRRHAFSLNAGMYELWMAWPKVTDEEGKSADGPDKLFLTPACGPPPVISKNKGTSLTLTWKTTNASPTKVHYGATYGSAAGSGTDETDHEVEITGLTANTEYKARVIATTASKGKKDLLLYPLGEEKYSKDGLKGGPHKAVFVVQVKMRVTVPHDADVALLVGLMRKAVKKNFNDKFYIKGKVRSGDQEWTFPKGLVHFTPRFLINNGGTPWNKREDQVTSIDENAGAHVDVAVIDMKPEAFSLMIGPGAGSIPSRPNLTHWLDMGAFSDATFLGLFKESFARLVGLDNYAGLTAANIKKMAKAAKVANEDAGPIP